MALNACVLLVEDNAVNQEVGCAMMEAFGCRVDVASNGYEAIDRMKSGASTLSLWTVRCP